MTMTMNPMAALAATSTSSPAVPAAAIGKGSAAKAAGADKAAPPAVVRPFAPLMAPAGERAAGQPESHPAHQAQRGAADEGVDVLDAALMQALDELLGRGPATAVGEATLGAAAGGSRPAVDITDRDETASQDDASLPAEASAPLMAMLMPTLIPAAMPAAMPTARDTAAGTGRSAATSSTLQVTTTASAATSMPSALSTDAARLLALHGADPVATPTSDAGAWQGLQRWSADLTTMTQGAMSGAADVAASSSSTLTLPASREAWQQPLMQALGDRLQLQIAQRADSARLHLEPPQLGRIEIDIRQQGGALQVQLSASNDEVRQQLRQIAEPLRHELVQRHAGDVSVQVASGAQAAGDGRGRDGAASGGQPQSNGQPRDAQRQPGRALQDDDQNAANASTAFGFADALAGNAGGSTTGSAGAMGAMGVIGVMSGNTRTPR